MATKEPPRPKTAPWALAATIVAVVAILTLSALYVFRSARELPGSIVKQGLSGLARVAEGFRTGTVTTSFVSYATQIGGTRNLQVARLKQLEAFLRRDETAILWGALALPDVVIEARAPVEYIYYLDLDKPWKFRLDENRVLVTTPGLEWNTPALDVSSLQFVVREGSVFRDEAAVKERLQGSLTALLARRAGDHLALVREVARRQTEGFVEKWLRERFEDGVAHRARVVFADQEP